jgi:hypothetical protein
MVEKTVKLIKDEQKVEVTLVFDEVDYNTTKEMMLKNHYSKKWNTSFGRINIGVFYKGELKGIASFGNLMNPNSYKNFGNYTKDEVIELNRLWVSDDLGKNTETVLLSISWKIIRDKYPHVKLVQSFADGRLGCGTIYKASNFKYYGYTKSIFYENTDTKETFHKVPMENTMRPKGMVKLNMMWIEGKLRPFEVKTYRYVYPLYKNLKIDLKEEVYPSYDKGFEYLNDYIHNKNLIIRSLILSYILNNEEFQSLSRWAVQNEVSVTDVEVQLKNNSILEIAKTQGDYSKYTLALETPSVLFSNDHVSKEITIFDFI